VYAHAHHRLGCGLQHEDLLAKEAGLPSVYEKLPRAFRAIYKGPGHEVRFPSPTQAQRRDRLRAGS
jgi:hypothetical protein